MNMAFTAGCFFILQCIFMMDISVADPLIDVSPSEIYLDITSTLDINCTFSPNNHPDMAAFVSLVLSRANATGQDFQELAAITEFSPDSVKVSTKETVSATGVHSQTGESFLNLRWEYPTALQGGVYQCIAHGMDDIGNNIEMTNISSVTVDVANLNYIFQKLQQLEMNEASMRQQIQKLENDTISMQQNIQTLESDKISMEKVIADLKYNMSYLENPMSSLALTHVDFLGSNDTKSYYVSTYAFSNINKSIDVCKSLGGQLTVVNDESELTAIQGFLKSTSGISYVYISGSDEKTEGNWVLSDSDTPLPFTSWATSRPLTDISYNCLMLYSSSWTMVDYPCHLDSTSDSYRFMCEI